MNIPDTVSTSELAAWFGVSDRAVRDFESRGIIAKASRGRYPLRASVASYLEHLRAVAAGHRSTKAEADAPDLVTERAKLAQRQRQRIELELAERRRALVPSPEVAEQGRKLAAVIVSALQALPDRVADELAGMSDGHAIARRIAEETDRLIVDIRRAYWDPQAQEGTQ